MPEFRKALPEEVPAMARIGAEGKAVLKSRGVPQWQRGDYPSEELFAEDVRRGIGYVVIEDGVPAAVCALTVGVDASYVHLDSGAWLTPEDTRYGVIHRGAVGAAFRGRGLAMYLLQSAAETLRAMGAESIRVDTHPQNTAMQHVLEKTGFRRCGTLSLVDGDEEGDPRLAYELPLNGQA